MEHSLCVSEDSGASSGGAAQRGCNSKSCSFVSEDSDDVQWEAKSMRQCASAHEDTRGRHESLGEASRAAHFITLGRSTMRLNCAMRILRAQLRDAHPARADPSQRAAAGRHSQTLWNTTALEKQRAGLFSPDAGG